MTEVLANPLAARDHARAMAGTVVEAMPVLPPVADDLPAGVSPDDLLWEETIAAGGYATRRLKRGSRLRLIDLKGDACASILLSVVRTFGTFGGLILWRIGLVWLVDFRRRSCGVASADIRWSFV